MTLQIVTFAKGAAVALVSVGTVAVAEVITHAELSQWLISGLGVVLVAFAGQTLSRVAKVSSKLDDLDSRLDKHGERLARLEERVSGLPCWRGPRHKCSDELEAD